MNKLYSGLSLGRGCTSSRLWSQVQLARIFRTRCNLILTMLCTFWCYVILMTVILLNGCVLGNPHQVEQTIYSEDELFSVTIPKGWAQIIDYSLNDVAELQASKRFANQYFVALVEHKDDLEFTFEEWMEYAIEKYLASFDNVDISDGNDILIDGQPAKQFEIKGTIRPAKVAILATYVDGENHFAQILTWTLSSKYKSSVDDLRTITNSIKGL